MRRPYAFGNGKRGEHAKMSAKHVSIPSAELHRARSSKAHTPLERFCPSSDIHMPCAEGAQKSLRSKDAWAWYLSPAKRRNASDGPQEPKLSMQKAEEMLRFQPGSVCRVYKYCMQNTACTLFATVTLCAQAYRPSRTLRSAFSGDVPCQCTQAPPLRRLGLPAGASGLHRPREEHGAQQVGRAHGARYR